MNLMEDVNKASLASFFSPNEEFDIGGLFASALKEDENKARGALDNNTDALLNIFDQMQFYSDDVIAHPISAAAMEEAPYRNVKVPFGLENKGYFWTPQGGAAAGAYRQADPGRYGEATVFSGKTPPANIVHEATHGYVEGGNKYQEERVLRALDYFNALQTGDDKRVDSTMRFVKSKYPSTSEEDLMNIALGMI